MPLAIDVMHGHGPSSKIHCQLKDILPTVRTLLTKWSTLVLKVAMLYRWLSVIKKTGSYIGRFKGDRGGSASQVLYH